MKQKMFFMIVGLILFTSCEGSRTRRMIDTVDHAVESHNNGDSTELIVLIVAGILIGCLWLYVNREKFK